MSKIAIFVEGQTELIFTREYLLRHLYQFNINIKCTKLLRDREEHVPHDQCNPSSDLFVSIILVQNDEKVLSAMKDREASLYRCGFEKIIGLRDMYSSNYKRVSTVVDYCTIREFIMKSKSIIQQFAMPENISLIYSIMEIEAWLLAAPNLFARINDSLSVNNINERLNVDLNNIEVENIFHPANLVMRIYEICGCCYNKTGDNINCIMDSITAEDINSMLLKSSSFNKFHNEIAGFTTQIVT